MTDFRQFQTVLVKFDTPKRHFQWKLYLIVGGKIQMWVKSVHRNLTLKKFHLYYGLPIPFSSKFITKSSNGFSFQNNFITFWKGPVSSAFSNISFHSGFCEKKKEDLFEENKGEEWHSFMLSVTNFGYDFEAK